jgi:hypothetical protein
VLVVRWLTVKKIDDRADDRVNLRDSGDITLVGGEPCSRKQLLHNPEVLRQWSHFHTFGDSFRQGGRCICQLVID